MIQNKGKGSQQVPYMGRFVDKETFRVWVYDGKKKKLAESYDEYEKLLASGLWFDSKENALAQIKEKEVLKEKPRKAQHGAANS